MGLPRKFVDEIGTFIKSVSYSIRDLILNITALTFRGLTYCISRLFCCLFLSF